MHKRERERSKANQEHISTRDLMIRLNDKYVAIGPLSSSGASLSLSFCFKSTDAI